MAAVISQTSRMEWTAEHTRAPMSHAKTQRGGTVFCLAVSRRRTRIRFPCLTQRRRRKCEPVRGSCGRCRGAEEGCGRIECPQIPLGGFRGRWVRVCEHVDVVLSFGSIARMNDRPLHRTLRDSRGSWERAMSRCDNQEDFGYTFSQSQIRHARFGGVLGNLNGYKGF
jgi:hypothetical protein